MKLSLNAIRKFAVAGVLGVCATVGTARAELSDSLYQLATFGTTMGSFSNNLNQLLHSRSPQEQQQIQQRIEYVERLATMQAYSLESFIAADEAMAANQSSWTNFFGTGGDDAALDQVYQAFKQYQAMFSPHVLRATGQFPMPSYERLYIRWKQMPNTNPRMKEYAKQQFLSVFRSYARSFVYKTQSTLKSKRARFLDALKDVQNSGPFAMNDKMRFDKAFWDYQSVFKDRVEPKSGEIFLPEFPYNHMMTSTQQPNFVYNQSIYQQSGLNQFGYGATNGMGYQMGANMGVSMGMGTNTGMSMGMGNTMGYQTNMGMGSQVQGRYGAVTPNYQADQVVPLAGASQQQQQLGSPYGAFAPSSSPDLDAHLLQELYLKQKQFEQGSSSGTDVDHAYDEYMQLRNKWFATE